MFRWLKHEKSKVAGLEILPRLKPLVLFVTPVLTDGRSDVVLRFSGGFRRQLHHSEGILNLRIKLNTLFMPCSNLI